MRIAYGYDNAPEGINAQAIRQSLVASLKKVGKIAQAEEISKILSLEFTVAAQTLNLAKLEVSPSGDVVITKNITSARIEKLGNFLGELDPIKAIEKGKEEVRNRSAKASEEVATEQVAVANENLKELDDLVNSIIC